MEKKKWIYLETGSCDPYYNLAYEEYVLCHRRDRDYLILWQNKNTIVVGQNQNTEEEINRSFVERNHINVVRRATGGGAVYHDLGNLNYSFITDIDRAENMSIKAFAQPIVDALCSLGLDAELSGRNDILVCGCKVSGTAQRIYHDRILHHGTLLFDSDLDTVSAALNADPAKFESKASKSVRSRVANISSFLPEKMSIHDFWQFLKKYLSENMQAEDRFTKEEKYVVTKLMLTKYATWDWNYGYSPQYTRKEKKRWPGGTLEVRVSIDSGYILQISFYGDFLSLRPLTEITNSLRGCMFRKEDLSAVLDGFSLHEYFGLISKQEVLATIFDSDLS